MQESPGGSMPVPRQLIPRQWILPKMLPRDRVAAVIATFVGALDDDKAWRVTVEEHRPTPASEADCGT